MTKTYEYGPNQWEEAREEARQILIRRAREGQTIFYSELTGEMKTISLDPHEPALGQLLGEISREEHAAGRGMLSVLVVHKNGDQMPGPGFFELARELGEHVPNEEKFWICQSKKVMDCWRE